MSAFGVIQLHDDITRSNGNYCCVCFRTARERRLVDPVNFNIFMKNSSGIKPFKSLQVCYICEALAASAVKFHKAVKFASTVTELYADIAKSKQWQAVIKVLMDAQPNSNGNNYNLVYTGSSVTTNPVVSRAVDLDKKLRSMKRHDLFRTDILVVSSLQAYPEPPPLTDTIVKVDNAKTYLSPRTRVTGKVSVMQDQMIMSVLNEETKNLILHPLVKGLDGNVYVPSLNLQIVDNDQLKSVTDVHIKKFMPMPSMPPVITNPTINTVNTNNIINPQNSTVTTQTVKKKTNAKTKEKNEYHNFLLNQMQQKRMSETKKRKAADPLDISSLNDVQHVLNENAQGSSEVEFEIIEDDYEDNMTESRSAVLRTDRTVDWEDKIPMDVISFVDATDPNPQERIMQPPPPAPPAQPALGVIADVRTMADVRQQEIECIDLC